MSLFKRFACPLVNLLVFNAHSRTGFHRLSCTVVPCHAILSCPRRCVHTTRNTLNVTLLSAEELFSRKSLQDYLSKLVCEHRTCLGTCAGQQARLTQLTPIVECVTQLETKQEELAETDVLMKDDDPEIRKLAEMEKASCQEQIQHLRNKVLSLLVPMETADEGDLVLEVTAGVGGQEAMLFTAEMFDMYQRFAAFQGWDFETLEYSPSDLGGLRHASATVSGWQCYSSMKFEGGVHRVQRVPRTEKQGRIHTSTMTVAVLPQPAEITLTISAKDLRIETKRASGAGGQHVNTTDSAVRIVHIPTGVVSECQQERSQLKNKEKAMKVLRAKLYSLKLDEETSKRYAARKIQIGTKGRSEKIRTYNFPQDRITDHRIGKTLHDVKGFMLGEDLMQEMSCSLQDFAQQEALLEILEESGSSNENSS